MAHRIRLYAPHAGQRALHASTARFRVATCGRRFGKTTACVNETARVAWTQPGALTIWCAPTYRQTKIAWRLLISRFKHAFLKDGISQTELRAQWANGSVTQMISSDNYDAARGEGIHFAILDEAALIVREAWTEVIRPSLSDTGGRAMFISTPRGRNWFFELWTRGQDRERWPTYESWQLPSSLNPKVTAAELAEVRNDIPADTYRQEYEAAFLEDSAGVFRGISRCIQGAFEAPDPTRMYVLGWDPAKHADASIVTVMDVARRHVVAWDRWLQQDYALQLERVVGLAKAYGARVLMDSTGVGDPLLEQLQRAGLMAEGYTFTSSTKQQLVEHLAVTKAGNVRYSAPEGYHDDAVMSLGLAAWAARHGGGMYEWMRQKHLEQTAAA